MKTPGLSQALLGSLSQALFRVGTQPPTQPPTHPPTHQDKYEGDEIEQNLENESCLSVWVDPKNVFEPCPNLKNSQIRAKNFSISLFLC